MTMKRDRSGFTLVELLVAIGLFSIVVTVATTGFINTLKTQRQISSLISAESNVTLVLEQMAREERTGYLFCHTIASNNANAPGAACTDPVTHAVCTVSDSGRAADPGTPAQDIYGSTGDLAEWTCPALDYYTAEGAHVNYSLQGGALIKTDSSATSTGPVSMTGDSVAVKYLKFILFGNLEGDHWTPRITLSIGIVPSSTDPALQQDVLQLQTTVSARDIDCPVGGGSC